MNEKKLLIIGDDFEVAVILEKVCRPWFGSNIIMSSHAGMITAFPVFKPSHTIVLEYSEKEAKGNNGRETWNEAAVLKDEAQILIKCGDEKLDHPDYIQLPFEPLELKAKLGLN